MQLLSHGILDHIHRFLLGEGILQFNNGTLCIDIKCMKRFEYEKGIEYYKQPHLSIYLKQAAMYVRNDKDTT